MARLLQRLQDPKRSGVYRAGRVEEIVDAVSGSDLGMAKIVIAGKPALLRAIAKALEFPDWFGENWDALEDCLTDLSWHKAAGHVLLFEGLGALAPDERGTLIDVLASAAQFWAQQGKPFFAVFVDPGRALELPDLFREA
jgi:hypothetical protein